MLGYFKRIVVLLDMAFNVIVLFGKLETVSSRCGWQINQGHPCKACRWLCNRIDVWFKGRWKHHCINNRIEPPRESS